MGRVLAAISRAPRVLVVDDEPLIRWAIVEVLRESGCTVIEAENSAVALGIVADASVPFDVVLLDYWLPDSHSLEPLTAIKRLAPDSQVILMSAHASDDVAETALLMGAFRVLYKPFDMVNVAPAVFAGVFERRGTEG